MDVGNTTLGGVLGSRRRKAEQASASTSLMMPEEFLLGKATLSSVPPFFHLGSCPDDGL